MPRLSTIADLVRASVQLGACDVPGWSPPEQALVSTLDPSATGSQRRPGTDLKRLREAIREGHDPLGEAFCRIRSADHRRRLGQTYTPATVVDAQLDWIADQAVPERVIDGGTGSGRYLVAAAARWPRARLVGTDVDPVATLMARANLATLGLADRSRVELVDYRDLRPGRIDGVTAYPGNPPYVRHHEISAAAKDWLVRQARERGLRGTARAGLHVYFLLATAIHASPGDVGAFITAAEWLDTGYGALVRDLLLGDLGGRSVHVLEPDAAPFEGTSVTGALTTFVIGSRSPSMRLRRVATTAHLGRLDTGHEVARAALAGADRWSPLTRSPRPAVHGRARIAADVPPARSGGSLGRGDLVELGELCRVHRGTATGANRVWVLPGLTDELPAAVQHHAVTRARELFAAGPVLGDPARLQRVVDLPVELDALDEPDRARVRAWLDHPVRQGVRPGYLATHRPAWWSVGVRPAAPILATYMARRPPAFVRNQARVRHLNVAHGLYPREAMSEHRLDALAAYLRSGTTLDQGRSYAGGLVKFEPREMERLLVPAPHLLDEVDVAGLVPGTRARAD